MAEKYYLHRISHEANVSYSLLGKGYLTLGWSLFSDSDILGAAREEGYPNFDIITEKYKQRHNRSRWSIWYFAQMNIGDFVVVPIYDGLFSVYEIMNPAKTIDELMKELDSIKGMWNHKTYVWKDGKLFNQELGCVDLGFYIKVKPIVTNVPRENVSGILSSRMKIRTTTADITDIKEHVEEAIEAGKNNIPITLYGDVMSSLVDNMVKSINSILNPDKFERLVKWYLQKCGATSVWIPAKNESGKKDGADADIIAEFENLKYIIYVQAKWHRGETSDWAVHQIDSYKNQKCDGDSDYTYATWVITSSEKFSNKAEVEAEEKGVRLITGIEFAKMLLDIGLLDLNLAFDK